MDRVRRFQVCVKVNGVTKYPTVFKDMPAPRFKLLVCTMFGVVADETRFAFQGRDLEDDKTMGDYGLVELSNVEVLGRLRGGMPRNPTAVYYNSCDDFVKTHYGGFNHLTTPMLDTINNAVGAAFDLKKDRKHEMVTKLLTRIYDLLYVAEPPAGAATAGRPGDTRDLAQYEEWANSLSEKHRDYVHFLSKGLSPPISTRTMKVVADVMGVPSVIHDDDKIMETAKALAFHHFRLRGEVPPAGVATAGRPGDTRDLAQYEEWANSLSERHRDYVHFLSKSLSPPISTRTMKVVADVMGVPSVIHDDDKIMEAAKALAFHHFRLRGEVPPRRCRDCRPVWGGGRGLWQRGGQS